MTTTAKTSKFAGPCNACGQTVPAGEGILAGRMVGGNRRWLVRHDADGCIPPAAMPTTRGHGCLVHGPGDDECRGVRCITGRRQPIRPMCARHGNDYEPQFVNGCWECDAEAAEARNDAEEHNAVYTYKMTRGY